MFLKKSKKLKVDFSPLLMLEKWQTRVQKASFFTLKNSFLRYSLVIVIPESLIYRSNHDWKGCNMINHSTLSDDYLWYLILRGREIEHTKTPISSLLSVV